MTNNKALFIGFDNVLINTKSGRKFPLHSNDWELNMFAVDAIKHYTSKGYIPIIITNQDGVKDGYIHEKTFLNKIITICKKIESLLSMEEGSISFFYCIEEGDRRVPNNGLIIEALQEYDIILKDSIMIGGNELNVDFSNFCYIGEYIDSNDLPKRDFGV